MPGSQTRTRAEMLGSGAEPHARYWSQVRDRRPHPFWAQELRLGACSKAQGEGSAEGRSQLHKPQSKSGTLPARTDSLFHLSTRPGAGGEQEKRVCSASSWRQDPSKRPGQRNGLEGQALQREENITPQNLLKISSKG